MAGVGLLTVEINRLFTPNTNRKSLEPDANEIPFECFLMVKNKIQKFAHGYISDRGLKDAQMRAATERRVAY